MRDDYITRSEYRRRLTLVLFVVGSYLALLFCYLLVYYMKYEACIEAGKEVIGERCVEKEKTDG